MVEFGCIPLTKVAVSDCWFTYMTTYDSQLHRAACEETEKQKVEVFVVATLSVLQPRHRFREVQSVHTLVKFSAADWAMVDSCLYINQRNYSHKPGGSWREGRSNAYF